MTSGTNRRVLMGSLLVTALALGAQGLLRPALWAERERLGLSVDLERGSQLPPDLQVLQAALGSFRSWAINVMWLRATQLQDRKRFQEAVQLADWITRLSPRFERVWTFQSWNLAFNLCRHASTPEGRWQWVQRGVELVRDRGLEVNPLSRRLHDHLSFLYWFKIGDRRDPFHWYYKRQLAIEWQRLLGIPPDGGSDAVAAWFEPIARAPADFAALRELDAEVAEALAKMRDLGYSSDAALLPLVTRAATTEPATLAERALAKLCEQLRAEPGGDGEPRYGTLVRYLRRRAIIARRMDPELMLAMMRTLGPFDWRHPASHAAYWCVQGALRSAQRTRAVHLDVRDDSYRRALERPDLLRSLHQIFESGRVIYHPDGDYFTRLPDPRFLSSYEYARFLDIQIQEADEGIREIYEQDCARAATICYLFGEEETARRYYARLQKEYHYRDELQDFVRSRMRQQILEADDQGDELLGLVMNIFHVGYGNDRPQVAARFRAILEGIWQELPEPKRTFEEVEAEALRIYLLSRAQNANPFEKARVWHQLRPELRRHVFPLVAEWLRHEAERVGLDPDSAFPEPD